MKLDAVGVTSTNIQKTMTFYEVLGFLFDNASPDGTHVESLSSDGSSIRLMIDATSVIEKILGEKPRPGNHSSFALAYESPAEVDAVAQKVADAGYTIVKEPWDAFWGQRYAVVEDPDGYKVDLYAAL